MFLVVFSANSRLILRIRHIEQQQQPQLRGNSAKR